MTPEGYIIENMLRIADKDGNDVDFVLNSAQREIDDNLTGRDIIPKARQEGVSSYFLARSAVRCLGNRNVRAVVISHDTESTQRMLSKVHYYLKNIKGPKAVLKNLSKNEITFPKTNSVFYIGTAGSRQFGRGDTITDLHCSEVAYWPNPKQLLKGLFQAVPLSGNISIESTGNGVGNYYHKACMRASSGQSQYKMHFLPWHTFDEYQLVLTDDQRDAILGNLNEDWEEDKLVQGYGISAERLAWRRMKLEEMDYDLHDFKQEYPTTLDECFQATGRSIFTVPNFVHKVHEWKKTDTNFHQLIGHPRAGTVYVLGADIGGGVERDNSVIEVIDALAMEQVAEYCTNRLGPDVFAGKIASVGYKYNSAHVAVESNNHGIVTIKELMGLYPRHLIFRGERTDTLLDYGLRTTAQTKPLMIGRLRKELVRMMLIHSPELMDELSTFVETETGGLEGEEGCKDDRVIALALAVYMSIQAVVRSETMLDTEEAIAIGDPFAMRSIIHEMGKRREGEFPIGDQTGLSFGGSLYG